MTWQEQALQLKNKGMELREIMQTLNIDMQYKAFQKALWRAEHKTKGNVTYEDRKEYDESDVDNLINQMIYFQQALEKVNTKQVKTSIRIEDTKPIGIAYWGDWHIGAIGVDYKRFKEDLNLIQETDGLYFIGAGDYKDNYISGTHVGGNFEQILQPGMQDLMVKHFMTQVKDKCLALVRGCHDSWDKKQGDKDFLTTLCEITESVNLWHGGEINIKIGEESYLWRCRHKYKNQSSINYENAMRNLIIEQGPCDIAAEAHLHNAYTMQRHLCGANRVLLRTGSYKVWDEHGQQLAGYKGKIGVPVVILFPDRHQMIDCKTLDSAVSILNSLRK